VAITQGKENAGKVTGMIFIPDSTATAGTDTNYRNQIKQAVTDHGAVTAAYQAPSGTSGSSQTGNYFHTTSATANHDVLIVGWDDNISRTLFPTQPPGNGAWLVRNSWGTDWGMSGYFWMSYYTPIRTVSAVTEYDPNFSDEIFCYAPFGVTGWTGAQGTSNTISYANIFQGAANDGLLTQVVLYVHNPGMTYSVRVAADSLSTSNTALKTAAINSAVIHTVPFMPQFPGYYTIDVPVPLDVGGKKFAVAVTVTGTNPRAPIEGNNGDSVRQATSAAGQSFVLLGTNQSWDDVSARANNPVNVVLGAIVSQPPPPVGPVNAVWQNSTPGSLNRIHGTGGNIPIIIIPSHFRSADLVKGGRLDQASKWATDAIMHAADTYIFTGMSSYFDVYVHLRSDTVAPVPSTGYVDRFQTTVNGVNFNSLVTELAANLPNGENVRVIHLGNSDLAGQIGGHAYLNLGAMLSWGRNPNSSTGAWWEGTADPKDVVPWALHEFWGHGFAGFGDEYAYVQAGFGTSDSYPNTIRSTTQPADNAVPWSNFIGFTEPAPMTGNIPGQNMTHGVFQNTGIPWWQPTEDSFMKNHHTRYVPMFHKWLIYQRTMTFSSLYRTLHDFQTQMGITLPVPPPALTAEDGLRKAAMEGGTYTMTGDIELTSQLNVSGDLILDLNGHTLTINIPQGGAVQSGINISRDRTLTINDTPGGGALTINRTGGDGAGINTSGATLVINGGTITANGGGWSAGIGGAHRQGRDNGTVRINGGTVLATGQNHGAGIGGGAEGSGGIVEINGGTITATGGSSSIADIGPGTAGGYGQNIRIGGFGDVTASRVVPAFITESYAPIIDVQPSDRTVAVGGNAVFTITARAWPLPTYQWQVSTNDGGTWMNVSGATGTTLTIANVTLDFDGNRYRCAVTNSEGTVNSNAATLTVTEVQGPPNPSDGIDYTAPDITITGSGAAGVTINLTQETINLGDFTVAAFSTDGGGRWQAVRSDTFSATRFPRMFNRDMELWLSDTAIDRSTKQPGEGAAIVKFAKINKRPRMERVVINYLIGADTTGITSGAWVLSERNGTSSIKAGIEIALANGRVPDVNGYGRFIGANGSTNGIAVMPISGIKPVRTTYFIRQGAGQSGSEFTAASRARRINVLGEQRPPRYSVNAKSGILKFRAGTYIAINSGSARIESEKGDLNLSAQTGMIELWLAATSRRPASAKQVINR
jgi:hypothetical protein